jgi:hypothetical protein
MVDVKVPYPEVGVAAFEQLDTYVAGFLLSGAHPPLSTGVPMEVKPDEALKQFHVVAMGEDGLVPAVWSADPADAMQAVGVVTQAVTGDAAGGTTVPMFYTGHFDPEALVWHPSFDTPDKKAKAFNGAPTPTQIIVRARG